MAAHRKVYNENNNNDINSINNSIAINILTVLKAMILGIKPTTTRKTTTSGITKNQTTNKQTTGTTTTTNHHKFGIRILSRFWQNLKNCQLCCFFYFSIMLLTLLCLTAAAAVVDCQPHAGPFISQISPKSSEYLEHVIAKHAASHMSTSRLNLDSSISVATLAPQPQPQLSSLQEKENETRHQQHVRVERSALPILNEHFSKSSPNDVFFPSENHKEAAAGRYFEYNIKPTGTVTARRLETAEITQRPRTGKSLDPSDTTSSSFLLQGGVRPSTSRSPISPTSSTAISMATTTATATAALPNGRQNPSPDIQDIITGIVKLLNGNVNVHANTQGIQRRPTASRINNRGPPRISEAQTLPLDYDIQKPSLGSSIRPPYPFDRPDRPFITGVPIPEQIVPIRPGFVSNRPPWHRNKPRPPITTTIGGRRPIPQYKPLPASQMSPPLEVEAAPVPHQEQQPPPLPIQQNSEAENDTVDSANPTDTAYDSALSSPEEDDDKNTQYIEILEHEPQAAVDSEHVELDENLQAPPQPPSSTTTTSSPTPSKKDEHKKKPTKDKTSEKKKPAASMAIVEPSSVPNTGPSTYLTMPMQSAENMNIDPSMDEVIFMVHQDTSRTPTLQTTTHKHSESPMITTSSSSITTTPLRSAEIAMTQNSDASSSTPTTELRVTIIPTPSTFAPSPSTATTTKTTTTTSTTSTTPPTKYQPRPGIVLDDPEFKPGGRPRPQPRPPQGLAPRPAPTPPHKIQPTRQRLPPGYGEIFDVTLSAIQGPGSAGGSQQTINIKPYGNYEGGNPGSPLAQDDIIISASGEDGFVSIDGKRTYINLFGDPTDPPDAAQLPTTPATAVPQLPGAGVSGGGGSESVGGVTLQGVTQHGVNHAVAGTGTGTGYAVPETEVVELTPTQANSPKPAAPAGPQTQTTNSGASRPHYRPRTTQPPVRIDTCIVGDDSTCDQAQHERCKTENGVSSCHCRPGYSRRKHREPCRKVISFFLGLRVDRIYEHRIVWDKKLLDRNSEPFAQLSYESVRAIDSAMSMTPYSDEFMDAKVNNIYRGDPHLGGSGVFVNLTIKLDESVETLRPNLRSDVQKHLLGVIHRRNNNIGNSVLYVTSPDGAISALHDLDECQSDELNDCHASAMCSNSWGSFRCSCDAGLRDPWADQPQRAGRDCQACPDAYCNNRGSCSYNDVGAQECVCDSGHYGGQCEIDGEVLGVAIGASVAAVIIIVLTLVCLIMWSRRWQREQKNAMGSPVFGYMNTAPLKSAAALAQPAYQVTLEDRMRWAQIADVMAQTSNHYGAEPIGPTRPSSAMFAYPNLQAMGMGTMGGTMSMQSNMQMHQNANLPPVPLPRRLGLSSRSNGMRTLENSSSSDEEDRTDLLGRNFQVPRPKSRSNGSIANQSGIYYDVDYEPSGNGIGSTSVDHLYGSQNQSSSHIHAHSHAHSHPHSSNNHIPGPQGIPMSTYTSGRAPSSYYMK